ncbi:MAG TPA: DUF2764 family protein [Paludibacteraceae bacterium]|nr:DUF2764 family protein [Paludibacteraceae bacterium]HQB68870.1 DUF2764 family protein [Paludibacteraceae bacterium]HRS67136.1 DUF2764 family protein [Paludibacteraceae bacterium]
MNYYCLVAGLPDLQINVTNNVPAMDTLLEELYATLTTKDLELLNLLRLKYDNRNLLAYLENKETKLNPLGTLSTTDWDELILLMNEEKKPKDKRLQPYMLKYYRTINDEKLAQAITFKEDFLSTLYYDFGARSKNQFVVDWFEFNLNINNILAALACRKHGFDIKTAIVGNNKVVDTIRTNINARDFNLSGMFEQLDTLVSISENPNLLDREKAIDKLKWEWLEDHTFFNYFTIECVLAFYLRCELIHRWNDLTLENGQAIFRQLITDLKKDVNL